MAPLLPLLRSLSIAALFCCAVSSASALSFRKPVLDLDVSFESGMATPAAAEYALLVEALNKIKREWCSFEAAVIVGHADPGEGEPHFLMALSNERARSLSEFLQANGVPGGRIYVEGKGASQPLTELFSARAELEFIGGSMGCIVPGPWR